MIIISLKETLSDRLEEMQMDKLELLRQRLESVSDSYDTFVKVICDIAKRHPDYVSPMNKYFDDHPDAPTSDVIEFLYSDLMKKSY